MRTGFIAGCFDVMHPGYIKSFKDAKEKCDLLIVGLHKDPSIQRASKLTPILSIKEREELLLSLKYVDCVYLYETEQDLINLLLNLKPDIRFLGDDYKNRNYTGMGLTKEVVFLDRSHNWSSTKYKKLIYENYKTWSKE